MHVIQFLVITGSEQRMSRSKYELLIIYIKISTKTSNVIVKYQTESTSRY